MRPFRRWRPFALLTALVLLVVPGTLLLPSFSGASARMIHGAQGVSLSVIEVRIPDEVPRGGSARGTVTYVDLEGDGQQAEFHVVDGKYDPFSVELAARPGDARIRTFQFRLACTIAQKVTLKLELVDRKGNRSAPEALSFLCGGPPIGNYDTEQRRIRPTDRTLNMNLFILKDGVTTLARAARFPDARAPVGPPREGVVNAVRSQIVPAVTGIWDQCGLAFELSSLAVVDPARLELPGGTLDELLLVRAGELAEIPIADPRRRRPLSVLQESLDLLGPALVSSRGSFDPKALTVFVAGARLVARPGDQQHFGGVTTIGGQVSLIRWDAILVSNPEAGEIAPPTRPITAIAHEFGHNFGLGHVGLEEDRLNLMLSVSSQPTAVPPQPTVNLLRSQCERARSAIERMSRNAP